MSEDTFVPPVLSSDVTADENFSKVATNIDHKRFYLKPDFIQCRDPDTLSKELIRHYNLDLIVNELKINSKYKDIKIVTLQFPDDLVMDSSYVIKYFQDNDKDRQYFILADTSYSFCCVDEVAAEHVRGDMVIHFGESCFTQINKLPIIYSLGNPYMNMENIISKFLNEFNDKEQIYVLMSDSTFNSELMNLNKTLVEREGYKNILISGINYNETEGNNVMVFPKNSLPDDKLTSFKIGYNRYIYNINNLNLDEDLIKETLKDSALFHVTEPTTSSLMHLSTCFNNIYIYNPLEDSVEQPRNHLMKRYKEMHKARTANTFGILVNTLSIKNTRETVNKVTALLKQNYKKSHIFIVGKPNVAKLANFESIDIWVCIGCPQSGIIIDNFNEFYKPIITPFELTLAMETTVSWTGEWVLDNENIIEKINEKIDDVIEEEYSDEPVFDAVRGIYVSNSKPLRDLQRIDIEYEGNDEKALVKNLSKNLILKDTYSTAAESLQKREWTGLGSNFAKNEYESDDSDFEEEGASIRQGITGVARGYNQK
ncbi:hypothetical protein ACO0R3_001793 [Hanseniaspora guilliermondii]